MTEKSRDGLFEWDTEKNKVNIVNIPRSHRNLFGFR